MFFQVHHGCLAALRVVALALIFLTLPSPAAAFGDCESAACLGSFGSLENPAPGMSTGCVVAFDIAYAAPEGERRIRAINDLSAG